MIENLIKGITKEQLEQNYEVSVFGTKVVGTSFRNQEDIDLVEDNDYIYIEPEENNQYDPNACKVIHDKTGNHIGYIKADLAKDIKQQIKQGDIFIGKAETTGGTVNKQKGINLEIRRIHKKG
jgi:hypothetical protein